jgi:hypothetical protein
MRDLKFESPRTRADKFEDMMVKSKAKLSHVIHTNPGLTTLELLDHSYVMRRVAFGFRM